MPVLFESPTPFLVIQLYGALDVISTEPRRGAFLRRIPRPTNSISNVDCDFATWTLDWKRDPTDGVHYVWFIIVWDGCMTDRCHDLVPASPRGPMRLRAPTSLAVSATRVYASMKFQQDMTPKEPDSDGKHLDDIPRHAAEDVHKPFSEHGRIINNDRRTLTEVHRRRNARKCPSRLWPPSSANPAPWSCSDWENAQDDIHSIGLEPKAGGFCKVAIRTPTLPRSAKNSDMVSMTHVLTGKIHCRRTILTYYGYLDTYGSLSSWEQRLGEIHVQGVAHAAGSDITPRVEVFAEERGQLWNDSMRLARRQMWAIKVLTGGKHGCLRAGDRRADWW
ncbi:hypothetical protein FPV67DRAFT_1447954 [Lyophyllum atratum]|nr:hypothetical protein FPV67DRAFT_1447954 [Lyophyllum atratum]